MNIQSVFIVLMLSLLAHLSLAQQTDGHYIELGIEGQEISKDVPRFYCSVALDELEYGQEVFKLIHDLAAAPPSSSGGEMYHLELYAKDGSLVNSVSLDTSYGNTDPGSGAASQEEKAHRLMTLIKDHCH